MSCTSVLGQVTVRVYVDHEGLQLSSLKGVRLRVIPVDNIL